MVNTRTDVELTAAVQNALQTLLPQIRAEIREEYPTCSGPSSSCENPPPVTIHTWLERFNKQKLRSFEKATAPRGDLAITQWLKGLGEACDVAGKVGGKWCIVATVGLKSGKKGKVFGELANLVHGNDDLERDVSNEEIKRAVWDCGIDKAPGPDGFTFGFYRRYWDIIGNDVVDAVKWIFLHGEIPKGGNSSFITLIPKVPNANMVKDFRSISL
nr:RNA-directed DNA polymerase, eukaryota, reverse transcriptase zinc-binding domain protein [Tanacetum cinerariifolium]